MDDEVAVARELRKLESLDDDLFLDDVDGKWSKGRGRGKQGKRGRGIIIPGRGGNSSGRGSNNQGARGLTNRMQTRPMHGRSNDVDVDPNDLNNFDNWDLEQNIVEPGVENRFVSRPELFRDRSRPFESRREGGQAPNGGPKSYERSKPAYDKSRTDDYNSLSNTFDIESKGNRNERVAERGYPTAPIYGRGRLAMDNPDLKTDEATPGFIQHRKDPRLSGKQLESQSRPSPKRPVTRADLKSDDPYPDLFGKALRDLRPAQKSPHDIKDVTADVVVKDPRLLAQQVEKLRQEKEAVQREIAQAKARMSKPSESVRGFENRFMPIRMDPRQQHNVKDYNKPPSEKTIFEKISSNPALLANQIPGIGSEEPERDKGGNAKRGPRSPSPPRSASPVAKKDRNVSPLASRKRERSPRIRSSRWERSPSPARSGRRERTPTPNRSGRRERSPSPARSGRRERTPSPSRSGRRERSESPRRRSNRVERSVSVERRRERSHERSHERRDRSVSPRRDRLRRERSPSPRRRRRSRSRSRSVSRDRSKSARLSPPRQQQHQPPPHMMPGASSRHPPTRYPPQPGYDLPVPMYGDQYQQPPQGYGGPPGGPPQYPPYQHPQYHYDGYGYPPPPQQQPYGEYQQQPPWGGEPPRNMMYPDMSQPPPPAQPPVQPPPPAAAVPPPPVVPVAPPPPKVDTKAEEAKKEAIKNEALQQKQTLTKQREEYSRKSTMISRELQLLKDQEHELRAENSRDNERILRENNKLQVEIQNKLKAINNVIDMLTGIIGDKKELEEKLRAKTEGKQEKKRPKTPPDTPPKSSSSSSSSSPGTASKPSAPEPPVPGENPEPLPVPPPVPPPAAPSIAAPALPGDDKKPVFNYVHYDPEMHWCRVCDVFPRTAKEFLNHLHSSEHKDQTLERKMVDLPWHKVQNIEEDVPNYKGAPTKRTPIRGLQFFISAPSWYCKLCDVWIGDLHCASLHLKSKTHTENYVNFTEQSPHWETDWLADREKAYERKADERRQSRVALPDLTAAIPSPAIKPQNKDMPVKEDKAKKNKKERKKERRVKDEKEGKKKKRKKKGKRKAKNSSGSESSSTSSSSNSSDDDSEGEGGDKGKSIRVAMRNKYRALEGEIMKELPAVYMKPAGGWQSLESKEEERLLQEKLEEERLERELQEEKYIKELAEQQLERERLAHERYERQMMEDREGKFRKLPPPKEDKMLREWMGPNKDLPEGEKQILSNIKDKNKQRQEAEKDRKRDERERYYENRHYEDGSRRRRRGESPEGRAGKRGRSRSPEDRRWDKNRGGKYSKRSPQHAKGEVSRFPEVIEESVDKKNVVDKKQSGKRVEVVEQDEAETKFERQAAEAAAAAKNKKKEKKPVVSVMSKSKLPFIGRMPIMKHLAKKKEDENADAKVAANPVLIGPALPPHMLAQVQASKLVLQPALPEKPQPEDPGTGAVVQDMDIDDEDSNDARTNVVEELVPAVIVKAVETPPKPAFVKPVAAPEPALDVDEALTAGIDDEIVAPKESNAVSKKPVNDIPLPKDFQEALNILFPGQKPPEEPAKRDSPAPQQPDNQWGRDVMPQGGPHPMSNFGPMMGMHPMYQNMMPQGMNGHPGYQQGMMGPDMRNQQPQGMMGPDMRNQPPQGMMGPDMRNQPPQGMMGPDMRNQPPQGMMGPDMRNQQPHGMMGPDMRNQPHGMMGPDMRNQPPQGMMGPDMRNQPPQGMMGPDMRNQPPQGMMEIRNPPLPTEKAPKPKKGHSDSESDDEGGNDGLKSEMSAEDLAMLGIDVGDMAAQNF